MLKPTPEERAFIRQHADEDVLKLALKLSGLRNLDAGRVIRQIKGLQVVANKVPSWMGAAHELLFPHLLSLEQCSSETTALYKAGLLQALPKQPVQSLQPEQSLKPILLDNLIQTMVDLTGGLGVDSWFLSRGAIKADYVERQPALCEAARHNFAELGATNLCVHEADSLDYLTRMEPVDLLYLDPARRSSSGSKVVLLSDCEPDVVAIRGQLLEKARYVLVKTSPMLDITQALKQLPETKAVHVVSVDNECKELLFLLSAEHPSTEVELICTNLKTHSPNEWDSISLKRMPSLSNLYADGLGSYVYEPNASLMKAGVFAYVSDRYGVSKLHPNSHLFTSNEVIPHFPGRTFRVLDCIPYQRKQFNKCFPAIKKANITVRNFPETVAAIRQTLKVAEGGDDYIFATTFRNEEKVLVITEKIG